jgi:hypothetical protein
MSANNEQMCVELLVEHITANVAIVTIRVHDAAIYSRRKRFLAVATVCIG